MDQPTRFPWDQFPDVFIHESESFVKNHHQYSAAKSGDVVAAGVLVDDTISPRVLEQLWESFGDLRPVLISVHAEEAGGVNAIPEAMTWLISTVFKWPYEQRVIQANKVSHTGASGFARLQRQAIFSGVLERGLNYLLVDDFVGQGGTLANLRGYILTQGGRVIGATALIGRDYSARLVPTGAQLLELRRKHGHLESWWRKRFGFGFDSLNASETRYLSRTPTSERIITGLEEIAR